jgi:hypothetical protein
MSSARALDIIDISRSLGAEPMRASPQNVCDWIVEEYSNKAGGGFNYDPSMSVIFDAFRGGHDEKSAVLACLSHGNPKGREQNASAIRTLMPYILANRSICHRIGLIAVAIGRISGKTVYAKIKAPLLRIKDGKAYVVMPGLRMSHRPDEVAIDVACSIAHAVLAQGDMARAEFEYLYAGPGLGKAREFRAIHGTGRARFDETAIDHMLNIFVEGVALAANVGVSITEPKLSGYRIIDPSQPGLSI